MAPDDAELHALSVELARESDPERIRSLQAQMDRVIENRIKRARYVPDTERR